LKAWRNHEILTQIELFNVFITSVLTLACEIGFKNVRTQKSLSVRGLHCKWFKKWPQPEKCRTFWLKIMRLF